MSFFDFSFLFLSHLGRRDRTRTIPPLYSETKQATNRGPIDLLSAVGLEWLAAAKIVHLTTCRLAVVKPMIL